MYDELIKALRCKGLPFEVCKAFKCPYFEDAYGTRHCNFSRLEEDAADAIEELQNAKT